MPTVLALSSHVAASRVGLGIIVPAFHALGIEVVAVPTVTLGRHPGWGAPGGGAVAPEIFSSVLEGALAHPGESGDRIGFDGVLTGYFASADQVRAAAATIDRLRAEGRAGPVLVDPVIGDAPEGLYVSIEVAEAIRDELLPRADIATPNLFEAGWLAGRAATDIRGARGAAAELPCPAGAAVVVTSVPDPAALEARIGAIFAFDAESAFAAAPRRDIRARGTGDLFAALFLGARLSGAGHADALAAAVGGLDAVLAATGAAAELPGAGLGSLLAAARPADLVRA